MKNYSNNWLATLEAKEAKKVEQNQTYALIETVTESTEEKSIIAPSNFQTDLKFPMLQAF